MNKEWIKLIIGAIFEVGWVIGMKHADSILDYCLTVIAIILSFYFLIESSKTLPVGTSYAIFVGLGTAGTVLSDIIFFDMPIEPIKLFFIFVLLVGVIGLKLVTNENNETEKSEV